MESSIGLYPEERGGLTRFSEGELVEVRQREKGLRGSWHPAVVIGVKSGRRVVVYDELLTDDGREKLTESIPVGKCLDGGKLPAARQPWKSPAKRTRALLRPRPPPLPDPASITWSKGLSVDCYFKDAWWEGVLTEAIPSITSASKLKRFWVWFPEEEDWEAMPLRDMRVGQQWDEDSGKWSLKGCVDVPVSRRGNRARSMSLGRESRGFTRSQRRSSPDSMELAIALKLDETSSLGREAEYTSAWNNIDKTLSDADAVISVQLNSPTSTPVMSRPVKPANGAGTDRSFGEDLRERRPIPLAVRSRSFESIPRQVLSSSRGRSREETVGADAFFGDEKDNAGGLSKSRAAAKEKVDRRGLVDRERILRSGAVLDKETLVGEKPTLSMQRRSKDAEKGNTVEDASREGRRLRNAGPRNDEQNRQLLVDSGWNVSRNLRKNGKIQWYYRSPNGCLLGSLASAMIMRKKIIEDNKNRGGDDDNPTLSDMKTPKSERGSTFSKGRLLKGRFLKGSRRVVSSNLVENEGGKEIGELQPSPTGYVNGNIFCKLGPPAGSNGILRLTNGDGACVSPLSMLNSKRNASEGEVIVDDVQSNELKRRKVQSSSIQQSELNSFGTSMSNRGLLEGSVGFSAILALMDSTSEDFGKPLNGQQPLETRSKKRTCQIEGIKHEHNNELSNSRNMDDRSIRDGLMDHEPKSKKSRVISDEVSCPPEGKSRKSLAILQESSRKKGSTAQKGADLKQAKKGTTQVKKSASHVKKGKKSRTPARAGVRLEVLLSAPGTNRDPALGEGELTRKRTLLSWLIDNGTVLENEKVRYLHRKDLHCMLEGSVTRDGILCDCCKKIVTLSVFEAHAGSKLHRPSANIFLDDGRSLSICQVEALAMKTQNESNCQKGLAEQGTVDKSDDTCGICGDGGELICCDHCPSTFHLGCMGLQEVPDGDWYCPNCRCASCGGSQFNGDQTTFNDLTVIFCDQCECEYHVKCLRAQGLRLSSLPQDDFFCGDSCAKIYQGLRSLVGVCKPMEGGFSWTLLRSRADDDRKAGRVSNTEINAEHDSKLSIALSVMQECFRPMIDPRTKIDIITHVLYNRRSDVSRLNYHGFYTMLLERADELISVATIRVHGARLAEMPLIGTRFQYRRQGMCRRLMSAIEEMLLSLGVERLVLPAVPELLDTWTGAFGFQPMDESQRLQLMDLNIMAFPGTSILYKRLEKLEPVSNLTLVSNVDQPSCAKIVQPGLPKQHSDASLASSLLIVKRGRGRPPKVKGEITNWNGLALAAPVAAVEAYKLSNSGHNARRSDSPVACQPVTVKRGRGRPPKNKEALFNPSDGVTLAASMAVVGANELAEAGRDAGHTCSPISQGVVEKAVGLLQPLNDQDQRQDMLNLPTVLRRKRGRPPRARVNYNSSVGILSTTAISIPVEQVDIFQGQMQVSLTARDPNLEANDHVPSQMLSEGRFPSSEENGVDELGSSAAIRKTTRSMREVRAPLWLVESADDEAMPAARTTLTEEGNFTTVAVEGHCPNDIPPLESSTTGSTKTYERRKSKLSPPSQRDPDSRIQGDESESEPTYGPLDFFNQDGQEVTAELGSTYEEVSVPIRAFPSQFASRGDHNTPPGTFIPVETIVVNSGPKVEPLDELPIPESDEKLIDSLLDRGEQRSDGKLLLRLKLPKKSSPHSTTGGVEMPQPSSPVIKLPNGALSPVGFTMPDQINEVKHFEQFEQGQPKQPDSSLGPHCISVTVS